MYTMELLKGAIVNRIHDVPARLCWKMISVGTQGKVKPKDQIRALYIYINKLDTVMTKSLLTELYPSKPLGNHVFSFGIQMRLAL